MKKLKLKDDETHEFSFLDVDIVEHSKILISNPPDLVEKSLDEFEKYVEENVSSYSGSIWSWQGDGGLCVFHGENKARISFLCALDILNSLYTFNLNKDRKPIDNEIRIRIGIHKGVAKYREQHGRIHSAAINFVAHLQKSFAEPNTIVISDNIYNELLPEQKKSFSEVGAFQSRKVYIFPSKVELERKIHTGERWIKCWTQEEEDVAINNIVDGIVKNKWYPDCIVAIFDPDAPGGTVVGGKLIFSLGKKANITPRLYSILIKGREINYPRVVIDLPILPSNTKRILIVDDVTFSGRTLEIAYNAIKQQIPNAEVKFATLAVGEEMEEKMKANKTPIHLDYPYKIIFGTSVIFSWDKLGPTGSVRKEFDIQYPDYLSFTPDYIIKPWGYMEIFALENKAFVRILTILPGQCLSYQRHKYRDEYFVALDDGLTIKIDQKSSIRVQKGDYIMIPRGTWHRFCNPAENPVRSLEVAFADKYDENDIERLEDDYGRQKM
jgi:hypoxanthine phosphoribosyltransferase/mannose-6-phosphate isomerase-like protein (cupin superfamily)/class 3 adenylate cyclase